jgi:hypothetical protein
MPMPPLPASHNTVKLNVRHTLGDDTNVENVLHGVYNSTHAPLSTADCQAIGDALAAQWTAQVMPALSHEVALADVTCTDLDNLTGVQTLSVGGAVGGDSAPVGQASGCLVVTEHTATRGRSYRGRVYLAGMSTAARALPQAWDPTRAEFVEDAFEAMNSGMITAVPFWLGFAVLSYYSGTDKTIPGEPPKPILRPFPIATIVTSWTGQTRIASQRRRNR